MVNITDILARASKTLILDEPYYGLFLIGLNKQIRKDIPTAGVSKNGIGVQLSINPGFFADLNEKQRIGLLKHELLHVSFGHIAMRDSLVIINYLILLQILRSISIYLQINYQKVV